MDFILSQYGIRHIVRSYLEPLDYLHLLQSLSPASVPSIQPTDAQHALNISSFIFHDLGFCTLWRDLFRCVFLLYGDELQVLSHYLSGQVKTVRRPMKVVLVTMFQDVDSFERAVSCTISGEVEDLSNKVSESIYSYISMRSANSSTHGDPVVQLFLEIKIFDPHQGRLWGEGDRTGLPHKADGERTTSLLLCCPTNGLTFSTKHSRRPAELGSGHTLAIGPMGAPSWISVPRCTLCEEH